MDHIALIADPHGNIIALETALADIKRRGIETIYCLGDLAGKGPRSAEVVDLIRDVCTGVVRGNWDHHLRHQQPDKVAITWLQNQLGMERLQYLRNLPNTIDFKMSGEPVRLYHASQVNEYNRVQPWALRETLAAMFENTEFTGFDRPEPRIVCYGDIHLAFVQALYQLEDHRPTPKTLLNAGSVGNPLDMPLATYAILKGHLDSDTIGYSTEIVRLPYDIESVLQDAAALKMPNLDLYTLELRHAFYQKRP